MMRYQAFNKSIYLLSPIIMMGIVSISLPAIAKPAKCLIKVDNVVYLDGICNFEALDGDSFTIGVGYKERSKYFAYASTGISAWNGKEGYSHAHENLYGMYREGACMRNRSGSTKLCAWAL
ncbi:hypothetical protein NON20_25580 (plasmid) [Synechocystis sp. B12]|nr:hypothetical protein NON20_25580 [Synechocystis sp. B12]